MEPTLTHLVLFIIGQVIASGLAALAIYGAIRSDLAKALAKAEAAETAAGKAHDRIDTLLIDR